MPVGESRNHRLAFEIDGRRLRTGQFANLRAGPDRAELAAGDRDGLSDRESRVDGDHVAVDEDRVRRRGWLLCAEYSEPGDRYKNPEHSEHPANLPNPEHPEHLANP